jgi:type VI secretion system secreted protein VgrG
MALSQKNRLLQVTTPLGEEALVVTGFRGTESISRLFSFELDLIAENSTTVDFSQLVGKSITLAVATPGGGGSTEWRYVNGICGAFSEGDRNETFTGYRAEVVPKIWLLTHMSRSRIFQQKSVPDMLKAVFEGYDCDYQLLMNLGNIVFSIGRLTSILPAGSWRTRGFIISLSIRRAATRW